MAREQKALLDDLDPMVLRTYGIGTALRARAHRESDATGLELAFAEQGPQRRLVHDVELAVYRIACEAISNVVAGTAFSRDRHRDFGRNALALASDMLSVRSLKLICTISLP